MLICSISMKASCLLLTLLSRSAGEQYFVFREMLFYPTSMKALCLQC